MTDKEIIKALECCAGKDILCKDCAYLNNPPYPACRNLAAAQAINLIDRQRAQIEAMTQSFKAISNIAKATRHEAYKVFAGRVIDLIYDADDINPVSEWQIRNLVKEMVGEKE